MARIIGECTDDFTILAGTVDVSCM